MEQRAGIKFYVKLKKTVAKTFEMLKSAYGEECLSRTSVSESHQMFKEGLEIWNNKIAGDEKGGDCIEQ
jgi:hypothetical protein